MTPRWITGTLLALATLTGCSTPSAQHQAHHDHDTDPGAATTCTQLLSDWTERYTAALEADTTTPNAAELDDAERDIAEQTASHLRWIHQLGDDDPDRVDAHHTAIDDLIVDGCAEAHPHH